MLLARGLGYIKVLELITLDNYLRQLPAESVDSRITIVGINDEDINDIENFPIPDREIANLLNKLQIYQPTVIGIDLFRDLPVEPGYQERMNAFSSNNNLILIEKALPPSSIKAPPEVPSQRVGFVDVLLDDDGQLRRGLLAMYRNESKNEYIKSFPLRLAQAYLEEQDISLENGIKDPSTMRFGSVEIPRFRSNTGGYIKASEVGLQSLINFRRGKSRFSVVSLKEVMLDRVDPELLNNKVVIVGLMADSIKDIFHISAVADLNPPGIMYGVEFHAHVTSQIISSALDNRPLINTAPESIEYLLIISCGFIAIVIGRTNLPAWNNLILIISASLILAGVAYLSLWIGGLWLPVTPVILVFTINGISYTAFYQNERFLKAQIALRQTTIEDTFTTIHNGPLQILATILRDVREQNTQPELLAQLESLNREIRKLGDYLQLETPEVSESIDTYNQLWSNNIVVNGKKINLAQPIHCLFGEIYQETLKRDNFPHFKTIKAKVVKFDAVESESFNLRQKHKLAEFLEEALCNVGKHAEGVTRLIVAGTKKGNYYTLSIKDNGASNISDYEGKGTKQFRNLEKYLNGKWRREKVNNNKETLCEFTWCLEKK